MDNQKIKGTSTNKRRSVKFSRYLTESDDEAIKRPSTSSSRTVGKPILRPATEPIRIERDQAVIRRIEREIDDLISEEDREEFDIGYLLLGALAIAACAVAIFIFISVWKRNSRNTVIASSPSSTARQSLIYANAGFAVMSVSLGILIARVAPILALGGERFLGSGTPPCGSNELCQKC